MFANIVQNLVSTHVGWAGRPQGQLRVQLRLAALNISFSYVYHQ